MTGDAAKAQEVFQDTLREAAFHSANQEPPPDRYWFFRQARWRCLDVTAQGVQPEVLERNLADASEHAPEQIGQLDPERLAIWISAAFDQAMATLVKSTPVPAEIAEWFANEKLAEGAKRSWRSTAGHPAILAIGIALAVIAVVVWIKFDEQMHTFPGAPIAKKLLSVASTTRVSQFEPVKAEAGTLSDLFVMKYRLEHYDVPPEFSQLRAIGVRVFDDD